MTLEDISVVFGDSVELSFEQALTKAGGSHEKGHGAVKAEVETVEDVRK